MKIKKIVAIMVVLIFLSNVILPTTLAVETQITNQNNIKSEEQQKANTQNSEEQNTEEEQQENVQTKVEQNEEKEEQQTQNEQTINEEAQTLNTTSEENNDQEVQFANENLKNYILENYDYNGDGKITISDMEQIESLNLTYVLQKDATIFNYIESLF